MAKWEEESFEVEAGTEVSADFVVDALVRESIALYASRSAIFGQILLDVSDSELLRFIEIVERVDNITCDDLDKYEDKGCRVSLLEADFTRAEQMADGKFRVPVADRRSLQRFLDSNEVEDALDRYCLPYLQDMEDDEDTDEDDAEGAAIEKALIPSKIKRLPVTAQPLVTDTLCAMAGVLFWLDGKDERYITPADTLEDVTKNIPTEMLIPLILVLEKHFRVEVDEDGCYKPVIWTSHSREYQVEDGVVWQVFGDRDLRWQLEFACEASELGTDNFRGVNGNRFNEAFYDTLTDLTRNEATEGFDNPAVDAFAAEESRRHDLKYGWLYRMATKATGTAEAQEKNSSNIHSGI